MTDTSAVGLAFAYWCAFLIYPDGMQAPSQTGRRIIIRRGWLLPNDLFSVQGLRNQVDYLTITLVPRNAKVLCEPLGCPWRVRAQVPPTVGIISHGDGVCIEFPHSEKPSGIVGIWDNSGASAACAVMEGDTPETIAQALASQMRDASASGSALSVPGKVLSGRSVGYGESVRTVRRQSQRYRVSIWTADPMSRETIGSILDSAAAQEQWIPMLDGAQAQLSFAGVEDVDTMQNESLYRRDFLYDIQFDTEQIEWSADFMFGIGTLESGQETNWGIQQPLLNPEIVKKAFSVIENIKKQRVSVPNYKGMKCDNFGTIVSNIS